MTIREFLGDRLSGLFLHLASMAALTAFLLATGTATGVVTIILIVWVFGLAVMLTVIYLRTRAHINELESIMGALDQKQLFAECIPQPKCHYERWLFSLMRKSGKAMIKEVSDARRGQQEYREYIESWVHEIKAPITAAGLICRSVDAEARRKLLPELANIDGHVERALFYARAESVEKDFIIRQTKLSDIVTQAVERHRALLIQSGVRVEMDGLDYAVYTDSKWAVFMVGQLLQNAVRYGRENPVISLSAKALGQLTQLTVQDNGIGIPKHELQRIFDRGFTGSNGRARGGATGMGLYICQKLSRHMSVDIRAQSTEGEGTTVTMTFPSKANLSKV